MVVTVEPGIYFSVYALQYFYLPSPIHSKYINVEVVQRYLPVGGVRIEDDILITSKGYENLTKAPKGDAMLEIIRNGKSNADATSSRTQRPSRRSPIEEESPLLRAPGISSESPELMLKPLARAATMPAEFRKRGSVDFEPFDGPSLFSNFKRTTTTDENVQLWRQSRERTPGPESPKAAAGKPTPVCGESIPGVEHVYMSNASSLRDTSRGQRECAGLQKCKSCLILVQTLDRLRQNLNTSAQSSPTLEQKPFFTPATVPTSSRSTHLEQLPGRLNTVKEDSKPAPTTSQPDAPQRQSIHARSDNPAPQNPFRAPPPTHSIPTPQNPFRAPPPPPRSILTPRFPADPIPSPNRRAPSSRPIRTRHSMGNLPRTTRPNNTQEAMVSARRLRRQPENSTAPFPPHARTVPSNNYSSEATLKEIEQLTRRVASLEFQALFEGSQKERSSHSDQQPDLL